MIPWIAAAFLVFGFIFLVRQFGLVKRTGDVVNIAHRSLKVVRNSDLDDQAKETALQQDAKQLFRLFFILACGGAVALLLPLGVVWLLSLPGMVAFESVLNVVVSPGFLIASCAFAIFISLLNSKRIHKTNNYSTLDRLLHRVAFATYGVQIPLAGIESLIFARQLAACRAERPVFITALPRAGTTLLLECCARLPEFAAHCYRDMPFVLTPYFWNRFSAVFKQTGEWRERAHKDGMLINLDSPEAFEEVLWKTFWRKHYHSDRIIPWQNEDDNEFAEFFRDHMRKIILLRRGVEAVGTRYISKNNGNIARIRMLHHLFPDAVILVPFREPLRHAASLLEQHRNFLRIHTGDPFASEYMRGIGHFDFGQNLRPIDFDGWLDNRLSKDAGNLAFWLEYWTVSYRNLLREHRNIVQFFNYPALCENPLQGLSVLAGVMGVHNSDELLSAAPGIHSVKAREVDTSTVPVSLLEEADELYIKLKQAARHLSDFR